MAKAFGVPPKIMHLPQRQEVVHAFAAHNRIREVFDIHDPVPLEEGIFRMAEWAKQIGPMTPVVFNNIEVTKNLPDSWQI